MAKRDIGAEIVAGLKEFRDKPDKLKRYEFELADVKGIRQKFGMTQQRFADFLMISVRTLQKLEHGERNPDRQRNKDKRQHSLRDRAQASIR